jgi:hypothetical protein
MLAKERNWLVFTSLAITAAVSVFFLLAPIIGYPLTYAEAFRIIQIVAPVFAGYLGAAGQFAFSARDQNDPAVDPSRLYLIKILTRGPIAVFVLIFAVNIFAFGYTNRDGGNPEEAMTLSLFIGIITGTLALLAATTSAASGYLFHVKKD